MEQMGTQTTTLSTIRDFLRAERREPPPWAPPTRAVDELYAMLTERRDDDLFWARLGDLASRLADRRFCSAALARVEALDGATVDRLLEDLRASIGGASEPRRTLKDWLGSAISVAALTGFLLLGTAAGCAEDDDDQGSDSDVDSDSDSDSDTDSDTDTDTDDLCDEAIGHGFSGAEGEIYCDLIEIIEEADVADWIKQQLYECLPELDADYRANLLEQFQSMSDAELAAYLQDMVAYGGVCYDDTGTH